MLFLEDINEPPYRVERMLIQLRQAGVLGAQRAIVLGDFSNYRVTDYDNGYDMDAVVAYLRDQLPVPVLTGLPFGHCARKLTLPVGARCGWPHVRMASAWRFLAIRCCRHRPDRPHRPMPRIRVAWNASG